MELVLNDGFCEMSHDEAIIIDGGKVTAYGLFVSRAIS
jgi:hypothetical protein